MMTTRTRLTGSGLIRIAFCVLLLIGSACEPAPKVVPSGDVPNAPQLARSTAALLLQLSAYDYAMAGTLSGQTTRVVSSDRWAAVSAVLKWPLPGGTDGWRTLWRLVFQRVRV